mmetsp:Transcript_63718/g.152402  ORF Transcript_63718/g.152402 Transcript_63718/m.152402 type:complete len:216 (+) Transcript_63718:412-1059(+)
MHVPRKVLPEELHRFSKLGLSRVVEKHHLFGLDVGVHRTTQRLGHEHQIRALLREQLLRRNQLLLDLWNRTWRHTPLSPGTSRDAMRPPVSGGHHALVDPQAQLARVADVVLVQHRALAEVLQVLAQRAVRLALNLQSRLLNKLKESLLHAVFHLLEAAEELVKPLDGRLKARVLLSQLLVEVRVRLTRYHLVAVPLVDELLKRRLEGVVPQLLL